jgi:hypothetical protein
MKPVFTIEQVDGKLVITIEAAEPILKEQDWIDWSKPVAFPKGYIATTGKFVYVLSQCMSKGEIITWYGHLCSVRLEDGEIIRCSSHKLAPINPTDHPLHPNFKGNK